MLPTACALKSLPDVAHPYVGHEIIVVADAPIGLPHGRTERDRARTTTAPIPVNAERRSERECPAKQLVRRGLAALPMQRSDQLLEVGDWRQNGRDRIAARLFL
jgi:hypothetical protein